VLHDQLALNKAPFAITEQLRLSSQKFLVDGHIELRNSDSESQVKKGLAGSRRPDNREDLDELRNPTTSFLVLADLNFFP